jgi:hypothetical protein
VAGAVVGGHNALLFAFLVIQNWLNMYVWYVELCIYLRRDGLVITPPPPQRFTAGYYTAGLSTPYATMGPAPPSFAVVDKRRTPCSHVIARLLERRLNRGSSRGRFSDGKYMKQLRRGLDK